MLESAFSMDYWKTFLQHDRFSLTDLPSLDCLSSKTALVTGGNTGLGYQTCLALAAHGCRVFMGCRSKARGLEAIEKLERELAETAPHILPRLELIEMDLADLKSVKRAAEGFLKMEEGKIRLDILVDNAGVGISPAATSKDGIEIVFAVNHMGHFLLTQLLLPRLIESQPSRIVIVSSMSHELSVPEGGIQFGTLSQADAETADVNYNRSKLANILYVKALARRLIEAGHDHVFVNAVHPGYCITEIDRDVEARFGKVVSTVAGTVRNVVGRSAESGALTQLYCAMSPEIEEKKISGRYFIPGSHDMRPSPYAMNKELQERLFKYSEDFMVKRGLLSI